MSRNSGRMLGVEKAKRSPRVNMVQKKLLVKLIENYFIRKVGHFTQVNLEAIEVTAWDGFAQLLNVRGPSKTPMQWKNCFYYMKNRIRKSVGLIRQCDASVKTNLSELDFKIYTMAAAGYFGAETDQPVDSESNNFESNADDEFDDDNVDFVADNGTDDLNSDFVGDENPIDGHDVNASEDQPSTGCEDESGRVLVADTAEQLEAYMNTSFIVSDEEEHYEESGTLLTENNETTTDIQERRDVIFASNGNQLSEHSQAGVAHKSKTSETIKTGARIPGIQKERLVQLVQNNFLKAFGRFTGENGKHIKAQLWRDIAIELNTLGPHRTGEQWKTTFESIKASAKAKLADDHNNMNGTVNKPLTRLEEKVLSIYGIDVLDGNQALGEAGFRYEKTVPAGRRVNDSTVTGELMTPEVNTSTNIEKNRVSLNSGALTCDDNSTMSQSHDEYENAVLEEILREIRGGEEPTNHGTSSRAVTAICPSQSGCVEHSTHSRSRRMSFSGSASDISAPSRRGSESSYIVDSGFRNRGSGEKQSESGNFEGSQNVNYSRPASSSLLADRSRVVQSHKNDASGHEIRGTDIPSSSKYTARDESRLHGSLSSARGRFSSYANSQRSNDGAGNPSTNIGSGGHNLQRSQNRVRGGSSSSVRGRFSPITQIQRSNDNTVNQPTSSRRQGSQNRVRGVPRLRGFSSSARGRLSPITNIQQFFNDNGTDDEDESGNASRTAAVVDREARDRSNLRHRQTSYEMVGRSIDAQEEFIDQDMRNHSEVMHVTERNHSDMLGIINSTLNTIASIAHEFVRRM